MNNYIVDPSVFYWINVLSIMQTVFAVFGGILISAGLGTLITYLYNVYECHEYPNSSDIHRYRATAKSCRKSTIILFTVGIVLVIASIFIPGKQTSIEMMVARTATFDNVDWTVAQVKEIIDYIVSALKGAV